MSTLVSIVIPARNEQDNIGPLERELGETLDGLPYDFEFIVIDNGSTDGTQAAVRALCERDPRWKYVRFSRDFGVEASLTAGYKMASGEAIIVLYSDLQDPPQVIPAFLEKWREGYDVVYGVRTVRPGDAKWRNGMVKIVYGLIAAMADVKIPKNAGDFRLISRRVADALDRCHESNRYMRGLIAWLGFEQTGVEYERRPRVAGESKAPIGSLIVFTLNAFTSFSVKPLRMFVYFGFLLLALSLFGAAVYVLLFLTGSPPAGITTLIVLALLGIGINSLGIGVLGEYLGRTYAETKRRPLYVISDAVNIDISGEAGIDAKGSDVIARFLVEQGVESVFELVGGMIVHLLDSIHQDGRIRIVSMHHEQGAAFAAEGFARITGVPGVALATSGPGATNLLTGVASCYFDSTPAVFITGQVNRNEMKGDRAIRQMGFQETEIVSLAAPITKAAWQVQTPEQLPDMLRRSFELALSGRPGPVLLDIPMDIQRMDVPDDALGRIEPGVGPDVDPSDVDDLIAALGRAERPLVLVGGGVRTARAAEPIRELLATLGVPVVNSLMGVDVLPSSSPLRVGMIGSYGNRWANLAMGRSDFLLVLGSRLDIRQTGSETEAFRTGRTIVQVDCDAGEMNNRITGVTAILADLKTFAAAALPAARVADLPIRSAWVDEIRGLREEWPDTDEMVGSDGINPNLLMHQLSAVGGDAAVYVADVGQHQMWAAQSLQLGFDQRFLTSGGLGSMGFGLPAAIGASVGAPGRPVVLVAGDGGFQTNIQELQTVARNQLPLKMLIVNNRTHGMVRQFQQSYFDSRFQSTVWGYSAPDFAAVAGAYGIPSAAVAEPDGVEAAVAWLMAESGPALLEVLVSPETNAYPKLAFGRPITEMEPFATPVGMEGT